MPDYITGIMKNQTIPFLLKERVYGPAGILYVFQEPPGLFQ
jgi:hypothetical protein